jgi:hypothetical protein
MTGTIGQTGGDIEQIKQWAQAQTIYSLFIFFPHKQRYEKKWLK